MGGEIIGGECRFALDRSVTIGHNPLVTPSQLKRRRRALGLTQAGLAEALGVRRETIARWEIGSRRIPELAARLLKTLGPNGTLKRKTRR